MSDNETTDTATERGQGDEKDELTISGEMTVEELVEATREHLCGVGFLDASDDPDDLRLMQLEVSFVDDDGILRAWETSHDDFDEEAFE